MAATGNETNERASLRLTVASFDRLVKQITKKYEVEKMLSLAIATCLLASQEDNDLTRKLPLAKSVEYE